MTLNELQYWRPDVVHELKTWPDPFVALRCGRKTFEFRRDDRGFDPGNVLVLKEWVPRREWEGGTPYPPGFAPDLGPHTVEWAKEPPGKYTGRELRRSVSYLARGPAWGIPEGFVVMSLQSLAHLDRNCTRVDCYECALGVQDEMAKRLAEATAEISWRDRELAAASGAAEYYRKLKDQFERLLTAYQELLGEAAAAKRDRPPL